MSTTPIPIDQFAQSLRTKYPGSYDHLSDAELTHAVVTKYPQYKDNVAGYAKTQFEKEKTEGEGRGVGGGAAQAAGFSGADVGTQAKEGIKTAAMGGPIARAAFETVKNAPANFKAAKATSEETLAPKPEFSPYLGGDFLRKVLPYVSGAIGAASPLLGFNPQSQRARAEKADTGGIVGENIVPVAAATLPSIKEGAGAISESRAGQAVTRAATENPIARVASSALDRLRVPEAQKAMTQAIQPGVNIPKAQESIAIAGPRMQQIRTAKGIEIPAKGPEALRVGLDLNREAKTQILEEIEKRMGPVADLRPNAQSVADAIRGSVDDLTLERTAGAKEAVEQAAKTYEKEGGWSIRQMENRMHTLNNHLGRIYSQPVSGGTSIPVSAEMDLAEAGALRKLIDSSVEKLSGEGVKDLKGEYGAQRDVEKALARQYAVATRVKGAPLWEGLSYLQAAGDFATGGVLGAAKGAAKIAVGNRLQTLRDPGYLFSQSFHGSKAFEAAEPFGNFTPRQAKGQLPAPAKEATPMPGPADASGSVRGGRYTTPAAQIGEGEPLKPEFLRAIPKPKPATPTPKGLLPSGELPSSNIPPMVDEKFAREAIGSMRDATKLGDRGQGGTRAEGQPAVSPQRPVTIKGELPAKFSKEAVKAAKYKPSEKAATMSAPAKDYGPEFNAQQAQEEINRARAILDNPAATQEERAAASARLEEAKEVARRVAPTEGERAKKKP